MAVLANDATTAVDVATLLEVLRAVHKGDCSVRMPQDWTGLAGKVADTLNDVIELNERLASELQRLSVIVGQRGHIQERASIGPVTGEWAESVRHHELAGERCEVDGPRRLYRGRCVRGQRRGPRPRAEYGDRDQRRDATSVV